MILILAKDKGKGKRKKAVPTIGSKLVPVYWKWVLNYDKKKPFEMSFRFRKLDIWPKSYGISYQDTRLADKYKKDNLTVQREKCGEGSTKDIT